MQLQRTLVGAAALVATSLLQVAASAQTVSAYGQIRLSLNSMKTGDQSSNKEMRDNASRVGLRGSEDLGAGQRAFFGLEMGLNASNGAFADTTSVYRNSYVGLGGPWGALAVGRLDSSNPTGSPLYSQVTAITSFAPNDAGATAIGTSMLNARNRTSNAVGYASPKFGGFDLRVRAYLRGAGTAAQAQTAAKSFDLGVNYVAGPIKAGLGWAKDLRAGGLAANEFDTKWQVGVRCDLGAVDVYALGGRDRYKHSATTRADVDYAIVGASATRGPHKVTFNVLQRDVQASPDGVRKRRQLGYQYALSRRTELQAFFDHDGIDSSRSGVEVRAIGAGIRHDF